MLKIALTHDVDRVQKTFQYLTYPIKNIIKGEKFTKSNIKCIRPGYGLPTKHFDNILNRSAKKNIKSETALKWNMIR